MSFRKGDVFHVVDTLHNGVVGSWQVYRIGKQFEPEIYTAFEFLVFFPDLGKTKQKNEMIFNK